MAAKILVDPKNWTDSLKSQGNFLMPWPDWVAWQAMSLFGYFLTGEQMA